MKILILQIRRLGDALMTTPLLRAIAQERPHATLDVCLEPSSGPAIRTNPFVAHLVVAPGGTTLRLALALRRRRYDAVIDTLGTPGSARLAFLSGARMRIGPDRPWRRAFYTHRVAPSPERCYSALEKLRLLEPLGIYSQDCRIELFPTPDEQAEASRTWHAAGADGPTPVVAFSPVSRRPRKAWPPERFAEICDRWSERRGFRFFPLFGPGEEPMVERVAARLRHREALLYPCDPVSFGALLPLARRCAFYVGNDNGIRHVAVAAGLRTAAVFGPPDPVSSTPPGTDRHGWVGGGQPADAVSIDDMDAVISRLVTAWDGACEGRTSGDSDGHRRGAR